jgi:DNA repair protein RadD
VFQTKLTPVADTLTLIKQDEAPIVEIFKVDHVTYTLHKKVGRPEAMKVSYFCGLQRFNEYVCFEHEGFAQHKARQWWKERTTAFVKDGTGVPFPLSTAQGIHEAPYVSTPKHLKVWVNKKYPEVLAYSFDDSAFGTLMQETAKEAGC